MSSDEWVVCPRCTGEGATGMEPADNGRFVAGSGTECPLCKGAMGFEDSQALERAERADKGNSKDASGRFECPNCHRPLMSASETCNGGFTERDHPTGVKAVPAQAGGKDQ